MPTHILLGLWNAKKDISKKDLEKSKMMKGNGGNIQQLMNLMSGQ